MRIDVVSIFPEYLDPLRLSLVGKAAATGLIRIGVHDLRQWTHDRHRTVDDTPYGGGAGMVMRPEPWGEALDALATDATRLVVLTPAGRRLDQTLAAELAREEHVMLACGRYEGIDGRVTQHAATRMRVDEVSVGDYVLNGGEVAALVVIEAVVRLLPGVIGNPASLAEESHASEHDGLLEAPVYTKPPVWRDLAVPAVLFSGHHGRVAAWRRSQAVALTRERRPDLLPPAEHELVIARATPADAGELLTLQRAAFVTEAQLNNSPSMPPLTETLEDFAQAAADHLVLVARRAGRMLGAVRGERDGDDWYIARLSVAPDVQGQGIGSLLLSEIEARAPASARRVWLRTGALSTGSLRFYRRRGYRLCRDDDRGFPGVVVLERRLS